jgi:hypothetical protein
MLLAGCGSGGENAGDVAEPADRVADADAAGRPDAAEVPDRGGEADAADAGDRGREADQPDAAAFVPGACGQGAYAWLPREQVGGVVTWEEAMLSNLTPEFIDEAMGEAGWTGFVPVPHGARNFMLRYVTQDRGQKVDATAVVGVPVGVDLDVPRPIMLWLHGTTGFMDKCAPSADPLGGVAGPAVLAALGFVVVAPDYLGMLGFGAPSPPGTIHPYLVGEATAVACLDAVRAAQAALAAQGDVPVGDPGQVVVWGASQGGHAAFFVERYAGHYAPELTVAAGVAAVPPTDLITHGTYAANTLGATTGALAAALAAMRQWYGHPADLTGVFTNAAPDFLATALPAAMAAGCDGGDVFDPIETLEQVFVPDFLSQAAAGQWDELDPWGCYFAQNSVGRTSVPRVSDAPFLAVFGETDDLVITPLEREDIPVLCAQGYRIEYLECAGRGHVDGAVAGLKYMKAWVERRLAGEAWPEESVCVVTPPQDCEKLE